MNVSHASVNIDEVSRHFKSKPSQHDKQFDHQSTWVMAKLSIALFNRTYGRHFFNNAFVFKDHEVSRSGFV